MKIELKNGNVLRICYCDLCSQHGGKFQFQDIENKIIYIRTGEQIAKFIYESRN